MQCCFLSPPCAVLQAGLGHPMAIMGAPSVGSWQQHFQLSTQPRFAHPFPHWKAEISTGTLLEYHRGCLCTKVVAAALAASIKIVASLHLQVLVPLKYLIHDCLVSLHLLPRKGDKVLGALKVVHFSCTVTK